MLIMGLKKYNRYIIYFLSLFIISLGASLSIKANLGTSPLICLPYVCSLITKYSVGEVMFVFTLIFIFIQIVLLRKDFEKRQYLQLIVGTIFSFFIDFSLMLVDFINPVGYVSQMLLLLISCVVVAFGVLLEIQTEIVYLPADGVIVAISKVCKAICRHFIGCHCGNLVCGVFGISCRRSRRDSDIRNNHRPNCQDS